MKSLVILILLLVASAAAAEPTVTALVIAPGQQQFLIGSQAGISIHQLSDQVKLHSLATQLDHVNDLVFAPDGKYLLAVGGAPAEVGEVELYTWPDRELRQRFRISDDLVYRASWSRDSKWFASCGHDNLCLVTTLQGEKVAQYTGHSQSVLAVAVLPNSQQLLSAGVDQTIQLWSTSAIRQRTLNNHTATVTDLALETAPGSEVPRLVSTSEDRTVRLWQPAIGRMIKFVRLNSVPRRVAWHRNGKLIVATDDGSILIIDPDEMRIVNTFRTKVTPIYELVVTDIGILVGGSGGTDLVLLASNQ